VLTDTYKDLHDGSVLLKIGVDCDLHLPASWFYTHAHCPSLSPSTLFPSLAAAALVAAALAAAAPLLAARAC